MKKIWNNFKYYLIDTLIIFIVAFISFYNVPYVISRGGGSVDLSSRVVVDGKVVKGYYMNYVTVAKANVITYLASFIMPNWDRTKISDVTYSDTDYETTLKIEKISMKNSLDVAKMVACNSYGDCKLDIESENYYILGIDGSADTDFELMDQVIRIDNFDIKDLDSFRKYIDKLEVGTKHIFTVISNDIEETRYATLFEKDGQKVFGIMLVTLYSYETDPKIELYYNNSEAGSSGGLMLSLAIYDGLYPDDLSNGKKIMGTGSINIDGSVGEIGGVTHKMMGANKDGCDIFFVPEENYDEAKKFYDKQKYTFKLIKVHTFSDAIDYLILNNK